MTFGHSRRILLFICATVLVTFAAPQYSWAESLRVAGYYGKYDVSRKKQGQQCLSLRGPKMEEWKSPAKPNKRYHLGISFPHLKDVYWLAVNYGLVDEAKKLGVAFTLVEAGGYDNLAGQQEQIRNLAKEGVDGLILGSINYTGNNELVAELVKQGIPVVEVINDIEAGAIQAKALVSFYEMGFFAGEHLANQAEAAGKKLVKVLFLPGPKGSGWADETLAGFKNATEFFEGEIRILAVKWGDTGAQVQGKLIKESLAEHPEIDYLVGNAVAASEAPRLLKESGRSAIIVGTYMTPTVYEGIKDGSITAAPADRAADQARIAVDMMVRLLEGEKPGVDFPFRAGPLIPVISGQNIAKYPFEQLFGPRDFKPVFHLKQ